jgi:hypothetical protein
VTEQLSVAIAFQPVPVCWYLHPLFVVTFCWPVTGQVIDGLSSSLTRTVKLQVAGLFAASRAVQVTVVTPVLKATLFSVVPVPVVAPDSVYVRVLPGQLSVAMAFQPVPE